ARPLMVLDAPSPSMVVVATDSGPRGRARPCRRRDAAEPPGGLACGAMRKLADDPRIDPRIKALMGNMPTVVQGDADSRETLLEEVNQPEAVALRSQMTAMFDLIDNEDVAPSKGLDVSVLELTSAPDGNTVKLRFIRPQTDEVLPCVYYIHGGGMASLS